MGRSVESVLELNGYTVLRVESGRRALEIARSTPPDALILDVALLGIGGIEVCRALVDDPLFDPSTPVVITAPSPVSNGVRSSAYQAGAWEMCSQPVDIETLLLKLGTFMRARDGFPRMQASMIDALTGLYNALGLQRVAEQIGARAARMHEPLGCVVMTSSSASESEYPAKSASVALAEMAEICRAQSRKSDVIGYVGDHRFAILVPQTDMPGVRRLVTRLEEAYHTVREPQAGHPLHSGYYAVSDFSRVRIDTTEIVRRASCALEFAQRGVGDCSVSYDELPTS